MKNELRFNHFYVPVVIWCNIVSKYALIGIIVGILVLMPCGVKSSEPPSPEGMLEISHSSEMFRISLFQNIVDRGAFNFECGTFKLYEFVKKSLFKFRASIDELFSFFAFAWDDGCKEGGGQSEQQDWEDFFYFQLLPSFCVMWLMYCCVIDDS